jgi:ABC-2 type transport system ATP-binding protein
MLELWDLAKRYGDVVALDGLSFSVEPGRLFGFVGPNGAGKTTAMRIAIGVLDADRGEVRWRGQPIDAEVRRRVGYMPEERGLYPKMRAAEQLAYFAELHGLGRDEATASAHHWLERLGVAERADAKVEELSLGNQQRVQLGAALVHRPDLLILDEPFSGLDPVGVDVLAEVLAAEARDRGLPVIFSSHQLELVERLCDAVAIVRSGRLVAAGRVDELRAERARGRWRVELSDGDDAWAQRVSGARRVGQGLFELQDGADSEQLLDAARAAGRVERFGAERPTLAELFRDVVAEGGDRRSDGQASVEAPR